MNKRIYGTRLTDEETKLVMSYACPDCGALPGAKCKKPSGGQKMYPHAPRIRMCKDLKE